MHEFVSCMKNETDHKQEVQRFFLWSISGLHLAFLFLFSHILSKYSLLKIVLCLSFCLRLICLLVHVSVGVLSLPRVPLVSSHFSLLFSLQTLVCFTHLCPSPSILLFFFKGISRISREETSDSLCEGNDCQ